MLLPSRASTGLAVAVPAVGVIVASLHYLLARFYFARRGKCGGDDTDDGRPSSNLNAAITKGGYESLIGNTPLLYLPKISALLPNNVKILVKMESMNPGGTGKDRAARSMILSAERRGELPPPLGRGSESNSSSIINDSGPEKKTNQQLDCSNTMPPMPPSPSSNSNIPSNIHDAILTALHATQTNGILIEGTSGSTGISLASLSTTRGHGVIVVMPDDQSKQKSDYLKKLGCGVVVVQNCSISNPGHYVNVAKRIWEWVQVERRYDDYYREHIACNNGNAAKQSTARPPALIQAAFMNQFENPANVQSHYATTGPEIYSQLNGKVDAWVMSAGTGGTLVGVGGYLKERWWQNHHHVKSKSQVNTSSPPKIVLVDPPGSSLFNKVKYGVAYAAQQSEQKLRRHRYDTLAEGIGLDRITANFGLGCDCISWNDSASGGENKEAAFGSRIARLITGNKTTDQQPSMSPPNNNQSKIIDDALSITDQQAVHMAHYLLRHEGLFVGSSTAMNVAGAIIVASQMPPNSNVVTVACDGGQRHTSRFWNRDFIVNEWGLVWPGDGDNDENDGQVVDGSDRKQDDILEQLGISFESTR